ncbi:unnamed protein product [Arabidopsis thaliana]|uniref:Methylesterase n=1 Tax=Arabidopsis thaliana TaxID=3702 RepID=A0A5S9X0U9_ARATH|nr:unnamed protein product [Arabidopsis thaliana]
MSEEERKQHVVLVHGACHGAWCWYKVKPQLEASGHRVTAVDLAASGIDMTRSITDISTCEQYSEPLMQLMTSLPDDEKVVLVGHSLGGLSLAMAMDMFPTKISVSVFVTAMMPDTKHSPSFVWDKLRKETSREEWLDTVFTSEKPDFPREFWIFGPEFMAKNLYQLSPVQDLELAKMLVRANPLIKKDMAERRSFSEEGYGSVTRIFIVCGKDLVSPEDYQRSMISNFPPKEVMEIKDADHMPMFSKPQQLCALLLEIANKYA